MKQFATLFAAIDQSTKTTVKVAALADYFGQAPEEDRLWTVALFSGRRPKRAVTTTRLREWAAEVADLPLWLFEESYSVVGDLAETIALILPPNPSVDNRSLTFWINALRGLSDVDEPQRKAFVLEAWQQLGGAERFLFNKLLTGGFRVGISQKLMTRALAKATGKPEAELAHRLMGNWHPDEVSWHSLIEAEDASADASRPYPFYLAYALEDGPDTLDDPSNWRAEWKWDGIRGQLILRDGNYFVWSRGEELMTDRFPELARAVDHLPPGTVLDGELLVWPMDAEKPFSFNALQKRIGRKTVPKKLLAEAPVVLHAYDLLEWEGVDLRSRPFAERRGLLEQATAALPRGAPVRLSPQLAFETWDDLATFRSGAREAHAEGLMLKRADSPYLAGRKKGDWWKWKLEPLTIDAVMIYAQAGSGRRANLFTDFTFAVWNGNDLIPFTKAYSGLTDAEFRQITAWVRKNTQQRFGPVRQVTPHHVFEIAFEGIQASPRHKSGVALRFPRMKRWRQDKPLQEANTLDDLNEMLRIYG
ncbi:ATP-dependent DNA ligase [Sulfitobacter mediterraneus]|uniref:ATP-dependent DNA ligase n=1 Tax=Sulfitobacter mediterraneus TaxID=83219 RepID=UPI00193A6DC8|nr:ATP-dependent DNA ligase [Sulfitobacter mediterraneus]MBM1557952.1 ATP-dependent DNA ligase [Sulfitobacter mediterraneus]MBM1568673.1 ATP-dependent DNA ligase [Sulfitobacter mediterraneus]MBM1573125.1 ATP-dependent DNA ligase [Sulfitobacter mediterraneus]MBM1576326.1 ATP-dependent DNA ligase [Sulfitobacter mediterraneus]MBM1580910.1 ATP-dependent DNA ligase [Sulfitobacter mediterraneus]